MFAQFFIVRPVAAIVLALMTVLVGVLALTALPISQYPDVVPPQVVITAAYPGQNAQKVSLEVAAPIEEQINGVEGMLYMESQCTNDGAMRLTCTFKVGTNPDMAQVLVQNRVAIALPKVPDVVRNIGVVTKKQSTAILLVVNIFSDRDPKTGQFVKDQLEVSNFARLQVKDELARLNGVGDVSMFGEREYSMRIWLDPNKMADYSLAVGDVTRAISEQNLTVAAGQIGAPPAPAGQNFQLVVNTQGRLLNAEEFENIVVYRSGEKLVRLKSVVRDTKVVDGLSVKGIELGARSYDSESFLDGQPAVGLPIYQLPGANAFETAQLVRNTMKKLEANFPEGIKYAIVFDPTVAVEASVAEVVKTLIEALVLVAIVVMVFLQNWRAAVIPMLAVPVALIGTLAAMYVLGYSINNLTLFGMVLAIGIVVDDAIVVVEAVEFHMARGMTPLAATQLAMQEVSGAIIGVSLVLVAVFVPSLLIPGITGLFFKQFAVVVAVSTLLSAFNSLTLSPALCPLLLKPHGHPPAESEESHAATTPARRMDALPAFGVSLIVGLIAAHFFGDVLGGLLPKTWSHFTKEIVVFLIAMIPGYFSTQAVNWLLSWFFLYFNWGFDKTIEGYGWSVNRMIRLSLIMMVVYVGLIGMTIRGFSRVPAGFIPQQDQGYLVVNIQLPDGASVERSRRVIEKLNDICLGPALPDGTRDRSQGIKGIQNVIGLAGFSIFATANISNTGGAYITLDPFEDRKGLHADAIMNELNKKLSQIEEGSATAFGAPPIMGLGNAGGFKMQIQDRQNYGLGVLEGMTWNLAFAAMKEPGIPSAFSTFRASSPQLNVKIDADRAFKLGVSDKDVKDALQVYLGSAYVNDITLLNRNWQVNVQADSSFRDQEEDIYKLKVRNSKGDMVPLAALVKVERIQGPSKVNRYNMYPAADLSGFTIPTIITTGQALDRMEQIAKRDLPPNMTYEWTDMAYQQVQAANTKVQIPGVFTFQGDSTVIVFGLSTLLAFLVMAYIYESFLLPLSVVLIVPMCLFSAVIGLGIARLDLNIFTQIGLVVLVGLASKNAILIVEFAKQKREEGKPRWEAALQAAKLRLRPILMTSFAFILGVVPLVIAEGAGAEMRRALGTAVFSGMIGVTIFGIFFTPVFYVLMQRLRDR
ncbi:efflux RND transporter permease subunit [Telmatocola sphagniphila]|uniref:Efflux RND transporter permease subunit n=1 Tax=Telmatocola sphagniphila TaxID=1123043 RepID=A0A8E6BCK5_9BACT|nr:efflux RND transporter permease subunit [Telmatocola sphagniphila]QVL34698.1 efflux RND transporter permease subunit [Telmatocola sphagniphila]